MARLFRKKGERQRNLWKRVVDLGLTDVRVAVQGLDHASLEALEEELLGADFGVEATLRLVDHVEELARRGKIRTRDELRLAVLEEVSRILDPARDADFRIPDEGIAVVLLAGVNGVGKTTSVAKLSHRLKESGRRVLVAATDTFRAGAIQQLREWAERVQVDFVAGREGGDPAAVAFDALEAASARGRDVVLVDTAGRLHTNRNLMEELRKIERVIGRKVEGAPHETLVVLDATIGQNAVAQLRAFREVLEPTGILLAKLDSSARGGIVVALQQEFAVPVKFVGLGEGLEDLEPFDADDFLAGLFDLEQGAERQPR